MSIVGSLVLYALFNFLVNTIIQICGVINIVNGFYVSIIIILCQHSLGHLVGIYTLYSPGKKHYNSGSLLFWWLIYDLELL